MRCFKGGGGWAALTVALMFFGSRVVFAQVKSADFDDGDEVNQLSDASTKEAKRHFVSGNREFEDGRYPEAIEHFRAVYEITSSPEILYNIGRCYEELGRFKEAVEHYEMFLRLDPDANDREEVSERIQKLSGELTDVDSAKVKDKKEEKKNEKESEKESKNLRLVLQMGGSGVLIGEEGWKGRAYVPFDAIIHFMLTDWFSVSGMFAYGKYMERGKLFNPSDPLSQVGLGVGASIFRPVKGRFSFTGRLFFVPTWVRRDRHKTALWVVFQGAVGTEVHIYKSWSGCFEIVASYGPAVIPGRGIIDGGTWHDPVLSAADLGARLGAVYAF